MKIPQPHQVIRVVHKGKSQRLVVLEVHPEEGTMWRVWVPPMNDVFENRDQVRHLRYFVVVAEVLSFTKAAQTLRISQPTLSRQVRELERRIGVRLLDRAKKRVSLTAEGRVFLFDSKRLLAQCAESVAALKRRL